MRSSQADKFIEIQIAIETQNNVGEVIQAWKRHKRCWAEVESFDTPERFSGGREIGSKLRYFRIRFITGLVIKNRVVYEEQNYNVLSIKELEREGRRKWLELTGELVE